ncbi:aspartic peptidase domain-containing protein [Daedaleopsis nitida]|nr:aspartic peptidase domain-containing protein [Daedaleopsis nitida]
MAYKGRPSGILSVSLVLAMTREGRCQPSPDEDIRCRTAERRSGGTVGIGDFADERYLVSITIGNSTVALQLNTAYSDLYVLSEACDTQLCKDISSTRYNPGPTFEYAGPGSFFPQIINRTRTFEDVANGTTGTDTVTLAGLTLQHQWIGVVNAVADPLTYYNGAVGELGLAFPAWSWLQNYALEYMLHLDPLNLSNPDIVYEHFADFGPFVPRLAATGAIEQPMFAITLQRDTIDVSGTGKFTIGQLPAGIDNSSITWVPVHRYGPAELPPSHIRAERELSTRNPRVDGPSDVFEVLLQRVFPPRASDPQSAPSFPCSAAHNLTFQIGGKLFPVDPRDFAAQLTPNNATDCVANVGNATRPDLSRQMSFSWILGAPFLKSNMVVFYYGNLTHPWVDPPRMGFLSLVPDNAGELLQDAVKSAETAGGKFASTSQAAPTSSSLITGIPSVTVPGRVPSVASPPVNAAMFSYVPPFAGTIMFAICTLAFTI